LVKLEGLNIFREKIKYRTGSIEFKQMILIYLGAAIAKEREDKEQYLRKLWRTLGFDTMNQSGSIIPNNLVSL
jgi:hypothetical protein